MPDAAFFADVSDQLAHIHHEEPFDDFGRDGATKEDWYAAARGVGLGVKRKADLHDFRKALKDKKRVHTTADRWYVTRL